jgi:hypothetical protein
MDSSEATGGSPDFQSAFEPHCSNNDCFDDRGQHVPDGVMVYDTKKQITVKPVQPPTTLYEQGLHNYANGTSDIEVIQHPPGGKITVGFSSTITVPGVAMVFCAAGANGIYMAGGAADAEGNTGAVAISTDSGQTWTPFGNYPLPVTTMVAAPENDIVKQSD